MELPVDDSKWPLVVVHWSGSISDATLDRFLAQMDRWLDRGERFGLLIDSRESQGLSPEQRGRLISHMKRQSALTSQFLLQAIVMSSLLQRTLFYGINLIFPNPFPSRVFGDIEAARSWLRSQLDMPAKTGSD
jgi:hypothetical protein